MTTETSAKPTASPVKKRMWIILSIMVLLLITAYVIYQSMKPSVTLQNSTDKVIYIYTMQSMLGEDEPTEDEMTQLKNIKVLQPQETIKITTHSLFTDKTKLSIGWKIGSRVESEAQTGHQTFAISSNNGICQYTLTIKQDDHQLTSEKQGFCYKKLMPITSEY